MAAKKKTTKKKTTAKKTAKTKEMLLVGSKVKSALKESDVNVSADAIEGLNEWVYLLIEQATKRAEANGRKTVRAHDFMS
ncbi:MAG: hypothetical protein CL674_13725 [Bdellovibrionaceae bacterium]|nr:hypothetical protein [Pseudobdellovibrionaceae bacterium]MEC9281071.1 hypothetical protein [Bdellovibrionota bacterium]|tara:strand:- start:53023 stop:53262 length:240 start_codon:yes stop_codon:yes gene_type:complete